MYSCCFFRSSRRQTHHHGGVTVVSRDEDNDGAGVARVKVVVSKNELKRIAADVSKRQCGYTVWRRQVVPTESLSLERLMQTLLRRRSEGGEAVIVAAVRRSENPRPVLDGIPEEA